MAEQNDIVFERDVGSPATATSTAATAVTAGFAPKWERETRGSRSDAGQNADDLHRDDFDDRH